MADKTESKPPFWSSLQGILTGIGAVIVAITGLITALYSTGAIGSRSNTNTTRPANTAVALSSAHSPSVPSPSSSPKAENDRDKMLTGKWEVIEERTEEFGGAKVTWLFDASVSDNVFTLTGKISAFNGKEPTSEQKAVRSTYVTKLTGMSGMGEFKKTEQGVTTSYPASIRLENDEQPTLHGTIEIKGQPACALTGRKL